MLEVNEGVAGPERCAQLVSRAGPGTSDEQLEDLEGLVLKQLDTTVEPQLTGLHVQLARAEAHRPSTGQGRPRSGSPQAGWRF